MNEISIIGFKLPENFTRTYSQIQELPDEQLPDINRVNDIISRIDSVKSCDRDTATRLLVNLDSCYPSKTDKRLESDFFTNAVIGLFMNYTPQVCAAAMNEILTECRFLPVVAEFKEYLEKHDYERLKPLNVAKMYQRRIAKVKPKGITATPEQIKKAREILK